MLLERGLEVDHSILNRWVLARAAGGKATAAVLSFTLRIGPNRRNYIKVRREWRYLYRAVDKHGQAVDFLLTASWDLNAAKRFFRTMLQDPPLHAPDRISIDGAGPNPSAIVENRTEGLLPRGPTHYVTKHLQQGIESDHTRVKGAMPRGGGFGSFRTARRTICGFETMLWLRKGFGFSGAWTVRKQDQLPTRG